MKPSRRLTLPLGLCLASMLLAVAESPGQLVLEPLDRALLDRNESLLERAGPRRAAPFKAGRTLSGAVLNARSLVALAAQGGQTVVVTPIEEGRVTVAYYDREDAPRWQRRLALPASFDFGRGGLELDLSSDGKRAVLYAWQDESSGIVAVYDEAGNVVAADQPRAHLAPSGAYLYGHDPFYAASRFAFYDSELRPLDPGIDEALGLDHERYRYGMSYRVFEGDILVARIATYERLPDVDPATLRRDERGRLQGVPRGPRHGPLLHHFLHVYDLAGRRLVGRVDLRPTGAGPYGDADYSVSLTEGAADVRGNTFVIGLVQPKQGVVLLTMDLRTGQVRREPVPRVNHLALSPDGSRLLLRRLLEEGGMMEIREVASGRVASRFADPGEGVLAGYRETASGTTLLFREPGGVPVLLTFAAGVPGPPLYGWFDRTLSRGLVPVRAAASDPTVRLRQVTLE